MIFNPLVVDGWFSKSFPGCGCMDVVIGFVLDYCVRSVWEENHNSKELMFKYQTRLRVDVG